MLDTLEGRIAQEVGDVRALIRLGDEFRQALASTEHGPTLAQIALTAPPSAVWRVYDHCAAITRLYAIYERFVEDLAGEWLSHLPLLWPNYNDLTERVRTTHREGVGRILTRLNYRRYRTVNPLTLMDGLRGGLSAVGSYALEPIAFVDSDRNYKPDVLRELFSAMGIEDVWPWTEHHRFVAGHIADSQRQDATLESLVREFIDYRNDAAHGSADQVLGTEALLELVSLVDVVVRALTEVVRDHIVRRLLAVGHAAVVGKVTEVFAKSGAVVAECEGVLTVGEQLVLRGKRVCRNAALESIQLNDQDCDSVSLAVKTEVGLRLGRDVKKNLELIRISIDKNIGVAEAISDGPPIIGI